MQIPATQINAATTGSPGYEIGYDQITSNVSVTAIVEAAGNTAISCAAHTFDGSPVIAHLFVQIQNGTGGTTIVSLFEGATQISRLVSVYAGTGVGSTGYQVSGFLRFTPTAGSHTYTVTAYRVTTDSKIGRAHV